MERSIMKFELASGIQQHPCPDEYHIENVTFTALTLARLFYESYHNTIDDEGRAPRTGKMSYMVP